MTYGPYSQIVQKIVKQTGNNVNRSIWIKGMSIPCTMLILPNKLKLFLNIKIKKKDSLIMLHSCRSITPMYSGHFPADGYLSCSSVCFLLSTVLLRTFLCLLGYLGSFSQVYILGKSCLITMYMKMFGFIRKGKMLPHCINLMNPQL